MAKPFFGQGPAPYIARMNMQAATDAGRAYGNAFKNIGSEVGGYLKTYGENKKKGEAADMQIGAILEGMSDERKAEITSGDNPLGKSLEKFIQGELPNSKKEALLGSLATLDARDRMDRQEQMVSKFNKLRVDQLEQANQQQKIQQAGQNQFSSLMAKGMANESDPTQFMEMVGQARDDGLLNDHATSLATNHFFNLKKAENDASKLAKEQAFEMKKLREEARLKGTFNLSPGQETADKEFGKSLVDFNEPDIRKGLEQLNEAVLALDKSNDLTGPAISLLPKFVRDRAFPESATVREGVEEVVQRNLRLVLGAQFTEKEGERLISRAFNPALQESENKKRVERLIKSIRDAMNTKIAQRKHFDTYGTLKGFDYDIPTIDTIEQNTFGADESSKDMTTLLEEEARLQKLLEEREGLFNTPEAQVIDAK